MVVNLKDIMIVCPVCEEDITLAARDIKLAYRHKTAGKTLIGCPNCARVLVLPVDGLKDDAELDAYISSVDDCCCIPLLDEDVVRIPAGFVAQLGKKMYRAGGGGPLLAKRDYMAKYGIDPEIALAKRGGGEAFKIGD